MNNNAVLAGTFDPFTLGHYEIARRAAKSFDKLYIAVVDVPDGKKTAFTLTERMEIARASVKDIKNAVVVSFSGFLVDFMRENGVRTFVRGLRNAIDFEYEKNLFGVYKAQWNEVEGFYLMTEGKYAHVSSSVVREMLSLGGDVSGFVREDVLKLLK